jgi:hypothetical protein
MSWYILTADNQPVAVSVREASKWIEENPTKKQIGFDILEDENGNEISVSTVFLGLDHSWDNKGLILWETMIFGGINDQYQERYSSYEDALEGHQRAIDLIKKENGEK